MAYGKPRDSNRSKVYRWEIANVMPHLPEKLTPDAAKLLARDVARHYGVRTPMIKATRRRNGGAYYPMAHEIKLSAWAHMRGVVMHELAHAMARELFGLTIRSHGLEFLSVYLDILEVFGNLPRATLVPTMWRHDLLPPRKLADIRPSMQAAACQP